MSMAAETDIVTYCECDIVTCPQVQSGSAMIINNTAGQDIDHGS